jgi:hypothetical protein
MFKAFPSLPCYCRFHYTIVLLLPLFLLLLLLSSSLLFLFVAMLILTYQVTCNSWLLVQPLISEFFSSSAYKIYIQIKNLQFRLLLCMYVCKTWYLLAGEETSTTAFKNMVLMKFSDAKVWNNRLMKFCMIRNLLWMILG